MTQYEKIQCSDIDEKKICNKILIRGWVKSKRDHGGILFIDLRDYTGVVQCVFDRAIHVDIGSVHNESLLCIRGEIKKRPDDSINEQLSSGLYDLHVHDYDVVSYSNVVPFPIYSSLISEDIRLKYRYLDLRRPYMQKNIRTRVSFIRSVRSFLDSEGFLEIHTPILGSSSPEGARDFLVPSRLNKGLFYALPQAPQQFKQILMSACFEKYYQIAPCFRDEDPRADRLCGDFYQIDLESSFVSQEDIFSIVQRMIELCANECFSNYKISFSSISYRECMKKYGTDKPNISIPLEWIDITHLYPNSYFPSVFREVLSKKGYCRVLPCSFWSQLKSSQIKTLGSILSREYSFPGLGYIYREHGQYKGPLAKFFDKKFLDILYVQYSLEDSNGIIFLCSQEERLHDPCASIIKYFDEIFSWSKNKRDEYDFLWVTEFPLFQKDQNGYSFSHNPFSRPMCSIEELQKLDPLDVYAYQYDLVCRGEEIGSGALRNFSPDMMMKIFSIAGYSDAETKNFFGALFHSFGFGAPPHGGIALGLERILMLFLGVSNIRDVIPFPLNQRGCDLMIGAPVGITKQQKNDLGIK